MDQQVGMHSAIVETSRLVPPGERLQAGSPRPKRPSYIVWPLLLVGRRVVQEFVGSMDLHRSRKGVILTTSQFSSDALDYVERIEGKKVVLIDGDRLCQLMIDYKIGVTARRTYDVFDVSQDFFDAFDS